MAWTINILDTQDAELLKLLDSERWTIQKGSMILRIRANPFIYGQEITTTKRNILAMLRRKKIPFDLQDNGFETSLVTQGLYTSDNVFKEYNNVLLAGQITLEEWETQYARYKFNQLLHITE